MVILVTGIAGFAGSHLAEYILQLTDYNIIGVDKLTYAGRLDNLAHLDTSRIRMIHHDFTQPLTQDFGDVEFIIHMGAETHVMSSLVMPEIFAQSNIMGTFQMLELARRIKPKKFLYVSTDEVFGASEVKHKEEDALNPSNPYAATKAAGEYLVQAWGHSFQVPYIITRCTNMYGARQHPEKFIPMTIRKIERNQEIEVHADANGHSGSRRWIHAQDHASALMFLLVHGSLGETYNMCGEQKSNEDVVRAIANGRQGVCTTVNAYDRWPGHDLHYALDDSKIRALGWTPKIKFEDGIRQLV